MTPSIIRGKHGGRHQKRARRRAKICAINQGQMLKKAKRSLPVKVYRIGEIEDLEFNSK